MATKRKNPIKSFVDKNADLFLSIQIPEETLSALEEIESSAQFRRNIVFALVNAILTSPKAEDASDAQCRASLAKIQQVSQLLFFFKNKKIKTQKEQQIASAERKIHR